MAVNYLNTTENAFKFELLVVLFHREHDLSASWEIRHAVVTHILEYERLSAPMHISIASQESLVLQC